LLVAEEVETFLAVVRAGSLLRGAEVVNATQSTVSYRVASLERRLGRRLLLRSRGGRGVSLTSEGRRFLDLAERWEILAQEAKELGEQGDLRLSIGTAPVLAGYLLPPLHTKLARPDLRLTLRIETGTGLDLAERVATGHLDVAFTVFRQEHVDLTVTRLMRSPMRVVVNQPAPKLSGRATIRISDLDPQAEVSMAWGTEFSMWRQKRGIDRIQTSSNSVALPALLQNQGVWSIVPEFMVQRLIELTGCQPFELVSPPPPQDVFRITRRGRRSDGAPEMRLLDRLLHETWPEWFKPL